MPEMLLIKINQFDFGTIDECFNMCMQYVLVNQRIQARPNELNSNVCVSANSAQMANLYILASSTALQATWNNFI